MRDRNLAPVALLGALACCGTMSLIAGLAGGVALAAIGRFTAVSIAGLSVVVLIAWTLDRRRERDLPGGDAPAPSAQLEETQR